jgi:hypothetical protein
MNESCGEAQRDEGGRPGRSSERGRKRAKDSIAIVSAGLSVRFDFEEREKHD